MCVVQMGSFSFWYFGGLFSVFAFYAPFYVQTTTPTPIITTTTYRKGDKDASNSIFRFDSIWFLGVVLIATSRRHSGHLLLEQWAFHGTFENYLTQCRCQQPSYPLLLEHRSSWSTLSFWLPRIFVRLVLCWWVLVLRCDTIVTRTYPMISRILRIRGRERDVIRNSM